MLLPGVWKTEINIRRRGVGFARKVLFAKLDPASALSTF